VEWRYATVESAIVGIKVELAVSGGGESERCLPIGKSDIISVWFLGTPGQAYIDETTEQGQAFHPGRLVEGGPLA
jgi:hypothetical protein